MPGTQTRAMIPVDHKFILRDPAFVSSTSEESFFSAISPIYALKLLKRPLGSQPHSFPADRFRLFLQEASNLIE